MSGKVGEAYRVSFPVRTGAGVPRTGLGAGEFLATITDPDDSATTTAAVAENSATDGGYSFLIPAAFSTTNGVGRYGWTVTLVNAPRDIIGNWVDFFAQDLDDVAAPGAEMDLITDAVDANSVATSGANEIRDTILSDATTFAGANINATISSRESDAAAAAREVINIAEHDATQALVQLENDATQVLILALENLSAGDAADAVWDELRAAHVGVGSFGEALDALISTRAAPGDLMGLVLNALGDAETDPDMDTYQARVWMTDDDTVGLDRYKVIWFKNAEPILALVTVPTIRVFQANAAGTVLFASTGLTEAGSEGVFFHEQGASRIVDGVGYFALCTATIDGSPRTWVDPVSRDRS